MKKIIEHVRNKPEHQRHQIIWGITGFIVLILIASWVFIGSKGDQSRLRSQALKSIKQDFKDGQENYRNYHPELK